MKPHTIDDWHEIASFERCDSWLWSRVVRLAYRLHLGLLRWVVR